MIILRSFSLVGNQSAFRSQLGCAVFASASRRPEMVERRTVAPTGLYIAHALDPDPSTTSHRPPLDCRLQRLSVATSNSPHDRDSNVPRIHTSISPNIPPSRLKPNADPKRRPVHSILAMPLCGGTKSVQRKLVLLYVYLFANIIEEEAQDRA